MRKKLRPPRWRWLLVLGLAVIFLNEMLVRRFADFRIDTDGVILQREEGGVKFMRRRYQIDKVDMWEYRTRPPRPPSLRGDVRLVGIGGSIMAPFGVPWREGFFTLLLEELRRANPGTVIGGVNLAEGGYSLLQAKLMLREQGLAYKPTLVLLDVGPASEIQYRLIGDTLYMVPYSQAIERRRARNKGIMRFLQQSYLYTAIEMRLMRNSGPRSPQVSMAKQVREISDLCRKAGADLVVLLFPRLDQSFPDQAEPPGYRDIKKIAPYLGFRVIDMREELSGIPSHKIRTDWLHYNQEGHRLIRDILSRKLHVYVKASSHASALSRSEICEAVAQASPGACRNLTRHPGRSADCLLQVSLKLAARGERGACGLNETPFARAFCEMLVKGHLQCDRLRGLANGWNEAKESFERAETFIEACELFSADRIAECRALGQDGRESDGCMIAAFLKAYVSRDPSQCDAFLDRGARETCRVLFVDDIGVCEKRVDFRQPIDPPWWAKDP